MSIGELLTRWTVRAALAMYILALTLRWLGGERRSVPATARLLWTAGCLSFLLHVAAAFHYYHQWSHRAAYESTARESAEVVGLNWGGGLYANYLFAVLWIADACWWWLDAKGYLTRSRWLEWAVQGFLGFIAFNATVVFGTGAIRWWGLAACAWLAAVVGSLWWNRDDSPARGE